MLKFDMLGYLSRYLLQNRSLVEEDIELAFLTVPENPKTQKQPLAGIAYFLSVP
jgi:hypothetical protein